MTPPNMSIMPHAIGARQDPATRLLRDRIRHLFKILPAALTFDEEGVHDMRVTTRRLGIMLPVLAVKPGGKRIRRAIRAMRRLRRAAGVSRDLDVSVALFEELASASNGDRRQAEILHRRLRDARRRSHRRMQRSVAALDIAELKGDLQGIMRRGADDLFTVLRRLREEQKSRGMKLLETMEVVGSSYDPDALHRLRRQVRRMRYLAEVNMAVLDRTPDATRIFRELQDALGRLHDAHVLVLWLDGQIAASEKRGQSDLALTARRLRGAIEATAREDHRAYLHLGPPANARRGLRAMGLREPAR